MEEYIDVYNSRYDYLGIASKSMAHRKGMWHNMFHCWLILGNGKVMLQRRSGDLRSFPNKLTPAVIGHLRAGEGAVDGVREIREELGIEIKASEVDFLYQKRHVSLDPKLGIYHRHIDYIFYCRTNNSLKDLTINSREISSIYEVELRDIKGLFFGKSDRVEVEGFSFGKEGLLSKEKIFISLRDFCPLGEGYYIESLKSMERYDEDRRIEQIYLKYLEETRSR